MEWLPYVHDAIEYIEDNLLTIQNVREVADKLSMSEVHLQKGFHVITGFSLAEYIRDRRLYEAAVEIESTDTSIVDIALKYGYEAQDAFTKAFIRFHGLAPGALRKKGDGYRIFLPIKVELVVHGGMNTSLKTINKYPFTLIGYQRKVDFSENSEDIKKFWEEFYDKYYSGFDELGEKNETVRTVEKYGIGEYGLLYKDKDDKYTYMIAGKYTGGDIPEDMSLKEIPAGVWAVFDYNGTGVKSGISKDELDFEKKRVEESSDYVPACCEYIEWYESLDEEKDKPGYRSALWIPVEKRTKEDKKINKKLGKKVVIGIGSLIIAMMLLFFNRNLPKKNAIEIEETTVCKKNNHTTAKVTEGDSEEIIEYKTKIVKYSMKDLEEYMMILINHKDDIGIQNMAINEPLNKIIIYDRGEVDIDEDRIKELIPEDAYIIEKKKIVKDD